MKRGLNQQEAMAYVGAKRRTWEPLWAPRLTGIQQGVCLIFDRQDLDRVFEEFKLEASGVPVPTANDDDTRRTEAHNGPRNGRPSTAKGEEIWAKKWGVSTPMRKTEPGKLTSGGAVHGFASVASLILRRSQQPLHPNLLNHWAKALRTTSQNGR